mgnify:CR=1 FL=1
MNVIAFLREFAKNKYRYWLKIDGLGYSGTIKHNLYGNNRIRSTAY